MTLTYAIKEGFAYERREASGVQSPLRTLDRRRGSCRDFAVLMMEAARALGIAARFVSGYVFVPSEEGDEPVRLGGGATHAWCQIYLPGGRLARVRPDQWAGRREGPHPRRGGARSRPGGAADRRLFRRYTASSCRVAGPGEASP